MAELPEMIQALLNLRAYPEPSDTVELVQTQMSFILLAGEYVYKIKKPVNLGYLDYTTLEKRRFYCRQEVELNRRVCPDAYLGVVSVIKGGDGFFIADEGEGLEYAVKMRRLPQQAMMDNLLREDKMSPQMLGKVAEKLAAFHHEAETNESISAFGDILTIIQNTKENFTQTEKYIGVTVSRGQYDAIKSYSSRFLGANTALFKERVADGRIRDCHGDLHAAHICFCDDICIYDCIEFNDRFRYCDVASEVAFLAMDLDHYKRADLSGHFVDAYVEQSRDDELKQLLGFYKCYRAYVRGKVGSFKYDDPYISQEEREKVLAEARGYFELAESYI